MRYFLFSALLCVLSPLFECQATGRSWYVAPDGRAGQPGTYAAPLADVQQVLDRLQPGDTLYLRGGNYPITQALRVTRSGTADRPIVITGYPRETVIIDADAYHYQPDGQQLRPSHDGSLLIEGAHHVEVSHLKVIRSRNVAIMVRGPQTSHITLRHCATDKSYSSGIALWYCDSVAVLHCDIARANRQDMATPGRKLGSEAPHEALTLAGATHFEVAYNHLHNCDKEGIDCKEVSQHGTIHHNYVHDLHRQGLYVDSWFGRLSDVEFYGNVVHDCEWGLGVSAEGKGSSLDSVRIHHNLLYDNRASGIYFSTWGHNLPRTNVWIYNNTIVNNGSPGHWAGTTGGIDLRAQHLPHLRIFNNIIAFNWGYEIGTSVREERQADYLREFDIDITDNWLANPHLRSEGPGFYGLMYAIDGTHVRTGDPGFIDYVARNFQLSATSGAIGAGQPDGRSLRSDLGALPFVVPRSR